MEQNLGKRRTSSQTLHEIIQLLDLLDVFWSSVYCSCIISSKLQQFDESNSSLESSACQVSFAFHSMISIVY
jgi:hypothetical protein